MDTSKITVEGVEDVSEALGEANPQNRLYSVAVEGRAAPQIVKVKTKEMPQFQGQMQGSRAFRITVSLCDATGAMVPGFTPFLDTRQTIIGPGKPTHGEQLEEIRRQLAVYVPFHHELHNEAIPGVAPISPEDFEQLRAQAMAARAAAQG